MDGFDGDVASMVAMLLRFASLTLAAAVRLPEVFAAQVLHGTGRWHHAAGLCAEEASRIASSQQRQLSPLKLTAVANVVAEPHCSVKINMPAWRNAWRCGHERWCVSAGCPWGAARGCVRGSA